MEKDKKKGKAKELNAENIRALFNCHDFKEVIEIMKIELKGMDYRMKG